MKKVIIFFALSISLMACSKQSSDAIAPPPATPFQEHFFSKVEHFKDNRTPSTDTVWTLRLFNQMMVDSFAQYNGYIYNETSTKIEVGVLWHK